MPKNSSSETGELKDRTDIPDLNDDAGIDQNNLNEGLIQQPAILARWLELHVDAQEILRRSKMRRAIIEAQVFTKIKRVAFKNGEKITETAAKEKVKLEEEWQTAQSDYIGVHKDVDYLAAGLEMLRQKKDMLMSLGANLRAGLDAEPCIKGKKY